jgi:AcrR family transcriptional regulator
VKTAKPRNYDLSASKRQSPVRERILGAAMSAFIQRGYAGTSTLEIATRAKVSKRELYAQFSDKQSMLTACVLERARRMRLPLEMPPVQDFDSLLAVLRAFGEAVLREVTRPPVTALFRLAIAEAERSPEVALELNTVGRNSNREALTRLLVQAKTLRLLEGDPSEITTQFLALLWGDLQVQLLLRATKPPEPAEIVRRARNATEAVLSLHAKRGRASVSGRPSALPGRQ